MLLLEALRKNSLLAFFQLLEALYSSWLMHHSPIFKPVTSGWVFLMQACLQQHENAASLFHIYWIYVDNPWYSPHLKVNWLAILISSVTFNPFLCHRRRRRRRQRQTASLTQWTWVWTSSGSWWWSSKPGMLPSMGSQRIRHD